MVAWTACCLRNQGRGRAAAARDSLCQTDVPAEFVSSASATTQHWTCGEVYHPSDRLDHVNLSGSNFVLAGLYSFGSFNVAMNSGILAPLIWLMMDAASAPVAVTLASRCRITSSRIVVDLSPVHVSSNGAFSGSLALALNDMPTGSLGRMRLSSVGPLYSGSSSLVSAFSVGDGEFDPLAVILSSWASLVADTLRIETITFSKIDLFFSSTCVTAEQVEYDIWSVGGCAAVRSRDEGRLLIVGTELDAAGICGTMLYIHSIMVGTRISGQSDWSIAQVWVTRKSL
ncbi:hypothetical protein OGATHE_003840 [Ogataea polymorpha]|uniref:Uncharacterized protein n=1 Tax=Ogataea polymorpha TaxID=460523 RepID=A0A9P8P4C3_9ASCO|nr:hypothetical protein OGATHE_003840 [Ogataea polymorpha]